LILFVLGVFLFLGSLGVVRFDSWRVLLPLFLIFLGVLTIWAVMTRGAAPELVELQVPLGSARSGSVRFRFGAGRLVVGSGAHADHLLELSARGAARVSDRMDGSQKAVEAWVPSEFWGDIVAPWKWSGEPPRWDSRLRAGLPLRLNFETGACEADLDLTELAVSELRLATGASSTIVRLPAGAGETRARIQAGAASVKVLIPPGVAARIVTQTGLGDVKVDRARFPGSSPIFESPDYPKAKNKVDLTIEVGAASVEIA
jgi:hypothetical protein